MAKFLSGTNLVSSRQFNPAAALADACGNTETSVGSGVATTNVGTNGNYWSNTANGESNAFNWNFNSGNLNENQNAQGYGFSVRLFHGGDLYSSAGAFMNTILND